MGYWGIATGVIGSAELADGSIVAIDLADGAVTTCKLGDDAVTNMKLAAGAVQTVHIADGAVVADHIGTGQVYGIHISDGQIGDAKIANGSITGGKLSYGGSGFDFAGKVRTCGDIGFVVRPGCGVNEVGGVRYCSAGSVLQYYNGSWQSITASGYQLGSDFHLPGSHASSQDGELWWDSGNYRPAFHCGGSTYCLSTYAEFDSLCGTVSTVCDCVASNCSRIDSLESGSSYQLGDAFYLPDYHDSSSNGELWWDSSYYRPAFYCGSDEIGLLSNPLPTSIPWSDDGELYWDSCASRPAYLCSYSSYALWALCTPLTVPTSYSGSGDGELRWCSSYGRLEFYCGGSWYYINSDGTV